MISMKVIYLTKNGIEERYHQNDIEDIKTAALIGLEHIGEDAVAVIDDDANDKLYYISSRNKKELNKHETEISTQDEDADETGDTLSED